MKLVSSRQIGLEVNAEKTNYMFMSHHHNVEQKHNIKTVNKSFECVAKFRYLGTKVTNENCIHEEMKSISNSGNATIQFRMFCLLVCYQKQIFKYTTL
jgi:hypothetical protein